MPDDLLIDNSGSIDDLLIVGDSTQERASIQQQLQAAQNTTWPLLIVGGVMDLTNHIIVPSYQVNLQDVYEEWDDNNKLHHRDLVALKIRGSFQLKFETLEQFQTFLIVMKDYKKQNRSYDCNVYCTNTLMMYSTELFLDFDPPNIMPYIGAKDYDPIEVTVDQRPNLYIRQE